LKQIKELEDSLDSLKQIKELDEKLDSLNKDLMKLVTDFLEYEKLFYKTVIDKGFKIAFENSDKSKKEQDCIDGKTKVCFETVKEIVRKALCIGDEMWTRGENLNSYYLRFYKKDSENNDIIIPKDDCAGAQTLMWKYIQKPSTVTRNGEVITEKRLLTFKRTGNHPLLISLMTDEKLTRKCWLSRVITQIGNSITQYREMVVNEPLDGDNDSEDDNKSEALKAKIAFAREIANYPFYVKVDIASHWAYYTAQMKIMSEARTKQYEVWLLRMGFPQMFMGFKDLDSLKINETEESSEETEESSEETEKSSEETKKSSEKKERGISIDDTSAILACLTHDKIWKENRKKIDMNGTKVWANPLVWTHGDQRKRSRFTDHQDKALVSISKLNSLFLNRMNGEKPGWTSKSEEYFTQLLHSEDTLNENSTDKLVVNFNEYFQNDENKELPFLDILTGNIQRKQENQLDDFLDKYVFKSITDLLDTYFVQSSNQPTIKNNCLICKNVSDLAIKKETITIKREIIKDSKKFESDNKKFESKIKKLLSINSIQNIEIIENNSNIYFAIKAKIETILKDLFTNKCKNNKIVEPIIIQKMEEINSDNTTIIFSIRRKLLLDSTLKKLFL
jgi:hypothetical protein